MKFEALRTNVFVTPVRPEQLEKKKDSSAMMGIKKEAAKTHDIAMRVVAAGEGQYLAGVDGFKLLPLSVAKGDVVMLFHSDDEIREEFERSTYIINGERCIAVEGWNFHQTSGAIAGKLTADAAD
jgi:hypothetical protein